MKITPGSYIYLYIYIERERDRERGEFRVHLNKF